MGKVKYAHVSVAVLVTVCVLHQLGISLAVPFQGAQERIEPKNRRVLEHLASGKCLTVSEEFVLFLDDCSWNKGRQEIASVFSVIKSNTGGHLLRWSSGPKPEGIQGCLADRVESEFGEVLSNRPQLVGCDARSRSQSWVFEKTGDALYQIRKVGKDGGCLTMSGHENDDFPRVVTCNTGDNEQVWRICENLSDIHKCDV